MDRPPPYPPPPGPPPGPPPYPPPPGPPPRQRSLDSRSARVLAEAKVKSREIDLVCVVTGHSRCSKEKIRLPPNVCVLTLTLLGDTLMTGKGALTREVKELVEKSSSSIEAQAQQFQRDNPGWEAVVDEHGTTYYSNPYINNGWGNTQKPTPEIIAQGVEAAKAAPSPPPPQYQSPSLTVSSFIDIAKKLRDIKTVYPKVSGGSIRARCGSENPKEQSKVTNQHFFGGTKTTEEFMEGIFMVKIPESLEQYRARIEKMPALPMGSWALPPTPPPVVVEDISSEKTPGGVSLLIPSPHGDNPTPSGKNEYTYKKTTKFQERIIQLESSGNPDETVSSSVEFDEELAKLYEQRSLFCKSLNFGEDFRSCIESCKGIDVMFLQHCYDCIVKWEQKHRRCAHEFFTQVDPSSKVRLGIEQFIVENFLPDEEKTRKALMMLSEKRKLQRKKFVDMGPQNIQYEFLYDNQLVQSLYLAKTCESIVQDLHRMFPERKILVILDGCRVTYENREPYASEHDEDDDDELFNEKGEGGARQKKKKTYKKKTYKKKTHKKKTHKKKTYKKKTHKKKINSFKNKK